MPYGIASILKQEIESDITDSTAADAMTLNPGKWASESRVPPYMYQSLQTLWLGSSPAKPLSEYIVPSLGAGLTKADGGNIVIVESMVYDSSEVKESMLSDVPGAESAQVDIVFQKSRNTSNPDIIRLAELRLRMLIDYTLRQTERQMGGEIPMVDGDDDPLDNSINPDYWAKCFWRGYTMEPTTSHLVSRFRVEYVRVFGLI